MTPTVSAPSRRRRPAAADLETEIDALERFVRASTRVSLPPRPRSGARSSAVHAGAVHAVEERAARRAGPKPLGVAGLFAGIGGIELGLHAAGHTTHLLCELDPGARAVLEAHFPGVALHADVRTLGSLPSQVELLCAGFPCQDLSQAGRTAGIQGSRSGLVHEVLRLLRSERTPWVLIENVPFMLQLARGAALDVILSELEALGYRWAYRVVNSRAFGLPQRRCRVFLVAALEADPCTVLFADEAGPPLAETPRKARTPQPPSTRACGFYWTEGIRGLGWAEDGIPTLKGGSNIGIPSPPAIVLPGGRIVKPDIRDAERLQGFAADWTAPALGAAKRGHRWKLVGNAVTVDVARWLGQRLRKPGPLAVALGAALERGTPWPKAACNVGLGRHAVHASEWPVRQPSTPLEHFLQFEPEPLSAKATAGFLKRTQLSTLHFPEGFLAAVASHLAQMQSGAAHG